MVVEVVVGGIVVFGEKYICKVRYVEVGEVGNVGWVVECGVFYVGDGVSLFVWCWVGLR